MEHHKHFGYINHIKSTDEIKNKIHLIRTDVNELLAKVYSRDNYNSFSASHVTKEERLPSVVMRNIADIFSKHFKGADYLKGLKIDEAKGRIVRTDIERYIGTYIHFLELFKYYPENDKYNIVEGLKFNTIDIDVINMKKMKHLITMMGVDEETLNDNIKNPVYKHIQLNIGIDIEEMLYGMIIDSEKKVSYSNFFNSYLLESFGIKNKASEFMIYKLSDLELSLAEYFNNEIKQYMFKEKYEATIAKYLSWYNEEFNSDLFEDIKKEPIITKYIMKSIIDKRKKDVD